MNENILYDSKNMLIFKTENFYSFNIKTLYNRSLKVLIKNIEELNADIDLFLLKHQKNKSLTKEIVEEEYAFKITKELKKFLDKNEQERVYKYYEINIKSINFSTIEEMFEYLQNLFNEIKMKLLEISVNYSEEELNQLDDAESFLDF